MPGLDDADDLLCGLFHITLVPDREEDLLHIVCPGEIAADGVGNQYGLVGYLGLAKGIDPLCENPDDRERLALDLKILVDGSLRAAEHLLGEFCGHDCNLGMRFFVFVVKETPVVHDQVAHLAVLRCDTEHEDVLRNS